MQTLHVTTSVLHHAGLKQIVYCVVLTSLTEFLRQWTWAKSTERKFETALFNLALVSNSDADA